MGPSRKKNCIGVGDRVSHRGHWDRSGGNNTRDSEGQNHRNGAGLGGGQGSHFSGRDGNNCGDIGARGGNGNNTNPPPTKTSRKLGAAVKTSGKEVGQRRGND